MAITSDRLKELGLIDAIVPEPLGGAHRDPAAQAELLKQTLIEHLQQSKLPDSAYEAMAGDKADEASRLHDALAVLEQAIATHGETTALVLLRHALRERLEEIDPDALSPREALALLYELKELEAY